METKKFQILSDETVIKNILINLGYKLFDCGAYWRTRALYRNGDNPNSLQIYKNTGVWKDYARGGKPYPFKKLIELTSQDSPETLEKCVKTYETGETISYCQSETIEMDKVYPSEYLQKLFPNYKFYLERNISEQTQKAFKTGLAGNGQMYHRMVFPIYDEHQRIIGFSGRHVGDHRIKWKHIGRKSKWLYPAYVPAVKTVDEYIDECRSVYLVESIGDAMALYDQGIKNVLVIFGVSISPAIINYLNSKDLDKIYICTNNDFKSTENVGVIAAIRNFIKLSMFFDIEKLSIKLPPKSFNDFGKAHENGYDLSKWASRPIDQDILITRIKEFIKNNPSYFNKDTVTKFLRLVS